ncbi:hypothetical protein BgiBS90_027211 [Biomphalaria glabrata]|nr:hypothetical protein BgiBS90_027211 [Biomphalaria glabrata]
MVQLNKHCYKSYVLIKLSSNDISRQYVTSPKRLAPIRHVAKTARAKTSRRQNGSRQNVPSPKRLAPKRPVAKTARAKTSRRQNGLRQNVPSPKRVRQNVTYR